VKYAKFGLILYLVSLSAISEDELFVNPEILALQKLLDKREAELASMCPRIKEIDPIYGGSDSEREYYNYAKQEIALALNRNISKNISEPFSARIGVSVSKDGTVEKIEVIFVKPATQQSIANELVKYGVLKLKSSPAETECIKYKLVFTMHFEIT
jgi:hypothetical protein